MSAPSDFVLLPPDVPADEEKRKNKSTGAILWHPPGISKEEIQRLWPYALQIPMRMHRFPPAPGIVARLVRIYRYLYAKNGVDFPIFCNACRLYLHVVSVHRAAAVLQGCVRRKVGCALVLHEATRAAL